MTQIFFKDPSDVLDYEFDWATNLLATGETILTRTITADTGITKDSDSEADGVVTVWLSGGTAGQRYDVACEIVTNAGRTYEKTITIVVSNL